MLRSALHDIRSVRGVSGVALVRKRDGLTEDIFPAAFGDDHARQLYGMLAGLYRHVRGFSYLLLKFERVLVHIFNQPDYLLFVTSTPEIDVRMFKMVVNSKLSAIARTLKFATAAPAAESGPDHATCEGVGTILKTLNAFSTEITQGASRSQLTELWRQAKKAKTPQCSVLDQYQIDPNGHWVLRKGQQHPSLRTICRPLADVTGQVIESLLPTTPEAYETLKAVIAEDREALKQAGFLHFLRAALVPAPSRSSRSSI